jgi:nicotinate-nucleotide adenylyltransferase
VGETGPSPGLRLGLFGGTFDPVHNAHVALAQTALDTLVLHEVRWIPAGQPWQKARSITAAEHREAMVRLAIAHEPRFVLDRIELDRSGASYTLDTVRALRAAQPGAHIVLLIGQDQYATLHTWRDWKVLLALVDLAVANRPGLAPQPHAEVLAHPHRVVPLAMGDVSSTSIRARVAAGQDISQLVPPEVARYIELHRLYRGYRGHPADGGPTIHGS